MATSAELTTRIAELETAIHELATNKVEEYYIGQTRVRYFQLDDLRKQLSALKRELSQLTTGGFSYVKFVGQS